MKKLRLKPWELEVVQFKYTTMDCFKEITDLCGEEVEIKLENVPCVGMKYFVYLNDSLKEKKVIVPRNSYIVKLNEGCFTIAYDNDISHWFGKEKEEISDVNTNKEDWPESIRLYNRDSTDLKLVRKEGDIYKLQVDDEHKYVLEYIEIGFDDNHITFIDPSGGPMISAGHTIGAGKLEVEEIIDRHTLRLKKKIKDKK